MAAQGRWLAWASIEPSGRTPYPVHALTAPVRWRVSLAQHSASNWDSGSGALTLRSMTLIGHTLDSVTFARLVQRCSVHRSLSGVAPLLEAAHAGGDRRCQHFLALSSTPPHRLRGARVHLHEALRHRGRRRLLTGHQPRVQAYSPRPTRCTTLEPQASLKICVKA